jgi:hypothetical protein
MEIFASAVKLAREKTSPAPGFNIMKELVEKQTGRKVDPGFSDGYGIVRKWQHQHQGQPDTPPETGADGFSIVKDVVENPTPVKKPQ